MEQEKKNSMLYIVLAAGAVTLLSTMIGKAQKRKAKGKKQRR